MAGELGPGSKMTSSMLRSRLMPTARLSITLLLSYLLKRCSCYPLISEVPAYDETCFRFNIPENDEAHMIFMVIPAHMEEFVEDFFVDQIDKVVQARTQTPKRVFARKLPDPISPKVQKAITDVFEGANVNQKSGVTLKVEKPRHPGEKEQDFIWFKPIVLNHVERAEKGNIDLDLGFKICFENHNDDEDTQVIFDIVVVSEAEEEEFKKQGSDTLKKEHLTPLEETLKATINTAQSILSEMRYMEKRESRMKQTADSINSKVRLFSWMSAIVLLSVAYAYVAYLKRYFHKKKLM